MTTDQLQAFFLYLVKQRKLSPASCRVYLNGIRFFYLQVLHWPSMAVTLVVPKRPQRIPELLTREEVGRILTACENPKHRMMLITCYGCGLRVSELVSLKLGHIDGERRLLRIEQGKGGIHALRHAYATHLLEGGLPVHQLQRLLGHQDLRSTLRYVHWIPDYREGLGARDLVASLGLPS